MSRILDEVLAANRAYSESFGAKGQLAMPPARRFAILTCMDARLDPAKFAGLAEEVIMKIKNLPVWLRSTRRQSAFERGDSDRVFTQHIDFGQDLPEVPVIGTSRIEICWLTS